MGWASAKHPSQRCAPSLPQLTHRGGNNRSSMGRTRRRKPILPETSGLCLRGLERDVFRTCRTRHCGSLREPGVQEVEHECAQIISQDQQDRKDDNRNQQKDERKFDDALAAVGGRRCIGSHSLKKALGARARLSVLFELELAREGAPHVKKPAETPWRRRSVSLFVRFSKRRAAYP